MRAKKITSAKAFSGARTAQARLEQSVRRPPQAARCTMIFSYLYRCVLSELNVFDGGKLRDRQRSKQAHGGLRSMED